MPPAVRPSIPSALSAFDAIARRLLGRRPAVFLDYDGTLTPIVDRPELAVLSAAMRAAIERLAARCPVAIVSGRDRADVERLVGLDALYYAGSHGFDITGPGGFTMQHEGGAAHAPALRHAERELHHRLRDVPGVLVEGKRYAVAVHYRLTLAHRAADVERAVDGVVGAVLGLRKTGGKKIFELRPDVPWDKGRAVLWLLEALGLDDGSTLPCYLGDDETDEDAFRALADRGVGVVVSHERRWTHAGYGLRDVGEVREFLTRLASLHDGKERGD